MWSCFAPLILYLSTRCKLSGQIHAAAALSHGINLQHSVDRRQVGLQELDKIFGAQKGRLVQPQNKPWPSSPQPSHYHAYACPLIGVTYLFTPCSIVLEKLTSSQLVKKFPALYGTRTFITTFTSACHLSLSSARLIQSMPHIPLPEDPR